MGVTQKEKRDGQKNIDLVELVDRLDSVELVEMVEIRGDL